MSGELPLINDKSSDEELMRTISNRDVILSRKAFNIIYDRYKNFLWTLCSTVCNQMYPSDTELAKDIFNNTSIAIYKNAHSYDASKGKLSTWMSRIARNELIDYLHLYSNNCDALKVPLEEAAKAVYSDNLKSKPSVYEKAIDRALKSLKPREREILLTYMMYKDGNKHLPDDVINSLCEKYQTTPANLRKIKQRALADVERHIRINTSLLQ